MRYLFDNWQAVSRGLKNKYLLILLDFDGTLCPIVETPEKAALPRATKELLSRLSLEPKIRLAFISGRPIGALKKKIGLKNVFYSGNHGMEIEGPKIRFKPFVPSGYRKALEYIRDSLQKRISGVPGARVEDKGLSLTLHYRLVEDAEVPALKTLFHEVTILPAVSDKIRVKPGKKVLEIRPPVEWDKGRVVLWLLARQRFAGKNNEVFPIYIGDDITDEDAFNALSKIGLTIYVGKPDGKSQARFYLHNPEEVAELLRRIYGGIN